MRPLVIRMWGLVGTMSEADSNPDGREGICLALCGVNDPVVHSGALCVPDNVVGVLGALVLFHRGGGEPVSLQRGEKGLWLGYWEFIDSSSATLHFLDLCGHPLCPKQFHIVLEISNVPFRD
jgi:hypothetical protein